MHMDLKPIIIYINRLFDINVLLILVRCVSLKTRLGNVLASGFQPPTFCRRYMHFLFILLNEIKLDICSFSVYWRCHSQVTSPDIPGTAQRSSIASISRRRVSLSALSVHIHFQSRLNARYTPQLRLLWVNAKRPRATWQSESCLD